MPAYYPTCTKVRCPYCTASHTHLRQFTGLLMSLFISSVDQANVGFRRLVRHLPSVVIRSTCGSKFFLHHLMRHFALAVSGEATLSYDESLCNCLCTVPGNQHEMFPCCDCLFIMYNTVATTLNNYNEKERAYGMHRI